MPQTATRQIVQPSGQGWETTLLCCATVALIAFTGFYSATFGREDPVLELQDWQISAFSDLGSTDQAIYSQLQVASEEIYWMHFYSGRWPLDEDFQDAFLAPFYRDLTWERNGALEWTGRTVSGEDGAGVTFYHGAGGKQQGQGAWLLLINHSHAGNTQVNDTDIWWNPDNSTPVPEITQLASLILNGWREVIPYSGRNEVERLNAE